MAVMLFNIFTVDLCEFLRAIAVPFLLLTFSIAIHARFRRLSPVTPTGSVPTSTCSSGPTTRQSWPKLRGTELLHLLTGQAARRREVPKLCRTERVVVALESVHEEVIWHAARTAKI